MYSMGSNHSEKLKGMVTNEIDYYLALLSLNYSGFFAIRGWSLKANYCYHLRLGGIV